MGKKNKKISLEIIALKLGHLILEMGIDSGSTVKDILNDLATTHREIAELAFDLQSQKLTGAMAVILNGSFIQSFKGLETRVSDGDVIVLVPLIDGG